jgi:endonuclease YncB( thermonuclease family)
LAIFIGEDFMRMPAAFVLTIISFSGCFAADATVTAADTLVLQGTPYRLDGVEAPETDQVCLDKAAAPWTCGIEARDQLKTFIGSRTVRCLGKQTDPLYRNRRISVCTVEGETTSINEWLVREGWALNLEPQAKGRFKKAEEQARSEQRGLWSGCFSSPQALRYRRKKDSALLGAACSKLGEQEVRDILFPDQRAMPAGCSIKGRLATRAHFTGHRGIYHLEGCRSYRRLKSADRWFCSETEAQADGFRPAFTCKGR